MFLNEDQDESSSQWAYAFSTFIGAAAILGWVGMTFGTSHFKTEPWDPIDPKFQKQTVSHAPVKKPQGQIRQR